MLTDLIWYALPADRDVQHRHRTAARGDLRAARAAAAPLRQRVSASSHPNAAAARAPRRPPGRQRLLRSRGGAPGMLPRPQGGALPARHRAASPPGSPACAASSPPMRAQGAARGMGRRATGSTRSARCWTGARRRCWQYIRAHGLPYNALHDRQYPSIGCSPVHPRDPAGREPPRRALVVGAIRIARMRATSKTSRRGRGGRDALGPPWTTCRSSCASERAGGGRRRR